MTLDELFKKRQTNYIKELTRYGRLIFNDHFILILFILLGAGGYVYSSYLETLAFGSVEPRIFVAFLYYIVVSMGSVTLLLEPADRIFLLPKEEDFKKIFIKMTLKSVIQSLLSIGILTVLTWPIFVATVETSSMDFLFIFLALASLKELNILAKITPFFESDSEKIQKIKIGVALLSILTILGLLFVQIKLVSLLIITLTIILSLPFYKEKALFNQFFNWDVMIEAEEKRMQRVYRFIGMFASVPNIETNIKRLPWLDKTLDRLSKKKPNASYYYILRTAARNTDYSMLVIRGTAVGALLLALTENGLISALLMLLFLYMIGFQLITLITEIQRAPQFQLYPIEQGEKEKAVNDLIFQLLIFVAILLGLATTLSLGIYGLMIIPIGFLFAYLFSRFYVARRVKKVY